MDNNILKRIIRNPHMAKKLLKTPIQAFEQIVQSLGILYCYKTDSITLNGGTVQESVALSAIKVKLSRFDPHEIKDLVKDLIVIWKHNQEGAFIDRLSSRIRFRGDKSDGISRWVKAVTGSDSLLDCAVVAHFIWQVKRKLSNNYL